MTEVSDSVGTGTGTTAVVDWSEDVARVSVEDALSTELVTSDSAAPEVEDADDPDVDGASDAPELVVAVASSEDFVTLESVAVAEAPVVGDDSAPDVGLPDPAVGDAVSSDAVGIAPIGMMVLLSVLVAVSLELPEEPVVGLRVGNSVDCSIAVADSLAVADVPLAVGMAELPVPTELSVPVEIGTGIAVVPSVPVEVLRL